MNAKKPMKGSLHPQNPHQGRYNFDTLCQTSPELKLFLKPNPKGDRTIDFTDKKAVLCLNQALLKAYYGINHWSIPENYLCPPIPGRADYIHYLKDLLDKNFQINISERKEEEKNSFCETENIRVLDIGTGASCIYPIIGSQTYKWNFVATDINSTSLESANQIINKNPCLNNKVELRKQNNNGSVFKGIIKASDQFDLTMCNPPFHSSMTHAQSGSQRKWKNLKKEKISQGKAELNFGGQPSELWCPGGEVLFLDIMAKESVDFSHQVGWFTSLVSKDEHIFPLRKRLKKLGACKIEVIKMKQGQKISRFIAWTFCNET